MTLGYLSDGWATVFALLVFAVLILFGWASQLRAELKRARGGKPEGW